MAEHLDNIEGGQELASVIAAFHDAAETYAHQIAVVQGEQALTYGDLNETASRVAACLAAYVDDGRLPIAILSAHHISGIVSLIAALKLGCPYSFLFQRHPRQAQDSMLKRLGAEVLVTDATMHAQALALAGKRLTVIDVDNLPAGRGEGQFHVRSRADDAATIYFTSGSTGRPKGVIRTNRNHLARAAVDRQIHREGPGSNLALLRGMNFSASSGTIFNALLNGATLHLADPEQMGPRELANWLVERRISSLRIPTPLLRQILDAIPGDTCFAEMRYCRPAGRLLRVDVERLWHHLPAGCRIGHGLASGESSLVTYLELARDALPEGEVVPVGRPVAGVDLLLVDEQGNPVPEGEIGLALVSSLMVTPGYWQNESLTNESIKTDPRSPERHTILTGDLMKRRPDGLLAFAGRVDQQVKIRGFRVELEAIEATLEQQPGVAQAAVKSVKDEAGETMLIGYVELEDGAPGSLAALRRNLAGSLPDYMIPARLIALDRLPSLGTNGKVDRAALPDPDRTRPELDNRYAAPGSETEIKLAAIWSELLQIDGIGVEDSFFDLGGHSLLAAKMVTIIRTGFAVELTIASIFENDTIRQLADRIETAADEPAEILPSEMEAKLRMLGY